MTRHTRPAGYLTSLAAVAAAALALSACNSKGSTDAQPTPATTSTVSSSRTSTSTSSSPTTADPATQRAKAAEAAVPAFWRELNRITNDPNTQISGLTKVSRGAVYAQWMQSVMTFRAKRLVGTGLTEVSGLTSRPTGASTYAVTACIDSSKTDLVNFDTKKSVIPSPRPNPRVEHQYEVTQDRTSQKWYLTTEKVTVTC